EVGIGWGRVLIELFDETTKNWDRFATSVGLHCDAKIEGWWSQLWRETTRTAPVLHWEQIQEGGQVLGWIAWAKSAGAMRLLIEQRPVIPSELPAPYHGLVRLRDVKFNVCGLLAETDNRCFERVATWGSTLKAFPAGQTVRESVGEFLQKTDCLSNL